MEKELKHETKSTDFLSTENTNLENEPILVLKNVKETKQINQINQNNQTKQNNQINQTKQNNQTKQINHTKQTKQIGYRFGCDHYLEFCILEEVKEVICNPGTKSANLDICKRIGNTVNLPDNRKLMFIHGQSRYYHDDKDNCDILLLDYTKNIFTTRRGELPRLIVEKSPYVNSLDEIVVILRQIHKLYRDSINNNSKFTN